LRDAPRPHSVIALADAAEVSEGITHPFEETGQIYPERRFVTVGFLRGRLVVLVSTPRGNGAHIRMLRRVIRAEIRRHV
jgi:uncharacterized DUF497 family protein